MRFSTVATLSAVFVGAIASPVANPGDIVYETRIVTITSCGPAVTSCPAKTISVPVSSVPTLSTPSPIPTSIYTPPVYLNTTAHPTVPCPTGTGVTSLPPKPTGGPSKPNPPAPCNGVNCPIYPIVPSGAPIPPKNTSVPIVPTPVQPTAPVHTGAAGKIGASIMAVGAAAAFALLA